MTTDWVPANDPAVLELGSKILAMLNEDKVPFEVAACAMASLLKWFEDRHGIVAIFTPNAKEELQ